MDPIQACRESLEVINMLARIQKEYFEKRVGEEAHKVEERLLREGVDPGEAHRRAREEVEQRFRDLDRPKPYRPGIRATRSQRPRDPGGLPALITGYVIAGVVIPLAVLAFYVLLALTAGG